MIILINTLIIILLGYIDYYFRVDTSFLQSMILYLVNYFLIILNYLLYIIILQIKYKIHLLKIKHNNREFRPKYFVANSENFVVKYWHLSGVVQTKWIGRQFHALLYTKYIYFVV